MSWNADVPATRPQLLAPADFETLCGLVEKYGASMILECVRITNDKLYGSQSPAQVQPRVLTAPDRTSVASINSIQSAYSVLSQDSGYRSGSRMSSTSATSGQGSRFMDVSVAAVSCDTRPQHIPQNWRQPISRPSAWTGAASPLYAPSPQSDSPGSTGPGAEKAFWCTLCFAEGFEKRFKRKDDCKTHLRDFHCQNRMWICPMPGCGLAFEFELAYVQHATQERGVKTISKKEKDAAMVELTPQLVFACGFANCRLKVPVFEAADEAGADLVAHQYCGHVAQHFNEGMDVADWKYSVQVGNLMRQAALKEQWADRAPKGMRTNLRWWPLATSDFKKVLEHRSWTDIPYVLEHALRLGGSDHPAEDSRPPGLPATLSRPLRLPIMPTTAPVAPPAAPARPPLAETVDHGQRLAPVQAQSRYVRRGRGASLVQRPASKSSQGSSQTAVVTPRDASPQSASFESMQPGQVTASAHAAAHHHEFLDLAQNPAVFSTAYAPGYSQHPQGAGVGLGGFPMEAMSAAGVAPGYTPHQPTRSNGQGQYKGFRQHKSVENLRYASRPNSVIMYDAPPLPTASPMSQLELSGMDDSFGDTFAEYLNSDVYE